MHSMLDEALSYSCSLALFKARRSEGGDMFRLGLMLIVILAMYLIVIGWPAGRICRRMGFSPWLGVLAIAPLFKILLLWFVAFAQWPASKSAPGGV